MNDNLTIGKLDAGDRKLILKIAGWYYKEWNTPVEKTVRRLSSQPDEDTLFQLVLTFNGEAVAAGGLCNEVTIYSEYDRFRKYSPWVALLYTHRDYRNRGFGRILLEEIERRAKDLHLSKIYLYSFTAVSLYKRCGWIVMDRVMYKGHETAVMEKHL